MTALPLAASPPTTPEAQPFATPGPIAIAASAGFMQLLAALTEGTQEPAGEPLPAAPEIASRKASPTPGPQSAKDKKPRDTEQAFGLALQIDTRKMIESPPSPLTPELSLARAVRGGEAAAFDETAPLPANTGPQVGKAPAAAPDGPEAKPDEEPRKVAAMPAAQEIAGPPANELVSPVAEAAPDRGVAVPEVPNTATTVFDAVEQASAKSGGPLRAVKIARVPPPSAADRIEPAKPQADERSPAPVQTRPEHIEPSPAPADTEAPSPPTPEPRPSASGRERSLPPRTQLAFGARLVLSKTTAERVTPQAAATPGKGGGSTPEDPPQTPRDTHLQTEDGVDEQQPADRPEPVAPFARAIEPAVANKDEERSTPDVQPAARAARAATPAEHLKPPVLRDIKLEVAGADHKVEVRLVERAGEVHFAVRTPDDRLAGALRDQLPWLSSKLEQSGFRADGWHAATESGAERQLDVAAPSDSSGQERQSGHRQNGQERHEQEAPRARQAEEQTDRKEKGKQFEWLFSSLR